MKGMRLYYGVVFCLFWMLAFTDCYAQTVLDTTTWKLIMTPDQMPVKNGELIILPGKGLFIANDNKFHSLDKERCPDTSEYWVLEKFPFEQIIINDGYFLVKYKEFVMRIGEEKTEIVAEFDTKDFVISKGHNCIFNVVVQEDINQYAWYKYDIRNSDADCVMRQNLPMFVVDAGKDLDFCVAGNSIYMINKGEAKELVNSKMPIVDATSTPLGLMFCTDGALYLYINQNVIPIAEGNFYSLYNDNDIIYVVLENGMIYKSKILEHY